MSLINKVAIITGASSGIGAVIAEKFNFEGAHVVIVGRNKNRLDQVAARLTDCLVVQADVGKEEDNERIIEEAIKKFGKIDILVNNAGISILGSVTDGDLLHASDEVMKVNYRAVVQLTKLATPHLIETKGNIINISSVGGLSPLKLSTLTPYSVSKAAVNHFSKAVALELSPHKVRVNIISPGPVRTEILDNSGTPLTWEDFARQTALNRVSEPEEVADLAIFLASDKAKGITGSNFVCDNGLLLK